MRTRSARRAMGGRIPSALVAALVIVAGTATLAPALAAPKAPAKASDLPPLPSAPMAVATPKVPTGDFTYVPGPTEGGSLGASLGPAKPPRPPSFDPARSTALAEQTTATRKVSSNPDGTFTTQIDNHPVRHQDAGGQWVDNDLTLAPGTDGLLHAKAAPRAARLGATATGAVATVDTPAGPLSLRHPGALAVPAIPTGPTARYPKALAKGADLALKATVDGFEETVTLPDAGAGPTYTEELVLPTGLSARAAAAGIEVVDAKGGVVGTYANGFAGDASYPAAGADATTPVTVRLGAASPADAQGNTAVAVTVGIDPAWLASPARKFPVAIDPLYFGQTAATGASDTMVSSGANANTSYWSSTALAAGSADGSQIQRSYVRFDLTGVPTGPDVWVSNATLWLGNWYSPNCTAHAVDLYELKGPFSAATTWNNRPTPEATGAASTFSPPAYGATGCVTNWVQLPATSIAQDWVRNGVTNNGIEVRATAETETASYRAYYSGESGTSVSPSLYITWHHQPAPSAPLTPADGAQLPTASPTLTATPVTDRDTPPTPVQYWFRASTQRNAEYGYQAVNSGWSTSATYQVPAGTLIDGETYWWHVYTWAGENGTSPNQDPTLAPATAPTGTPPSFRVRLDLGTSPSQPYDHPGPVAVNLASGNVLASVGGAHVTSAGGPVGVSFAYNAQAQSGAGLIGSYYADPGATGSFAGLTPAMVRTDPNLVFNWVDGPGAPLGAANYLVRWDGTLTAPPGTYNFSVAHDDGLRITVNNVVVLDRWSAEGATTSALSNTFTVSGPVPIKVELRTDTSPGGVLLGAFGTGIPPATGIIVPPSWLQTEPPSMPLGWSAGPGPYLSARVAENGAVLIDASGAPHTWPWASGGFNPPAGEFGSLSHDTGGGLSLHQGGTTYAFDSAGRLASATAEADDNRPDDAAAAVAAVYGWGLAGSTFYRLQTITDPVSGRAVVLHYAASASDAACPVLAVGGHAPAAGMLCTVTNWDGTQTQLFYNAPAGQQLARIVEPGGATNDFGYNAAGLLVRVRNPLEADAVAGGFAPDNDTSRTVITYTASKATRVVMSAPARPRPRRGAPTSTTPAPPPPRCRSTGSPRPPASPARWPTTRPGG